MEPADNAGSAPAGVRAVRSLAMPSLMSIIERTAGLRASQAPSASLGEKLWCRPLRRLPPRRPVT